MKKVCMIIEGYCLCDIIKYIYFTGGTYLMNFLVYFKIIPLNLYEVLISIILSVALSIIGFYISMAKSKEEERQKRIEKQLMLKSKLYKITDWANSILRNLKDKSIKDKLYTREDVLPQESLILLLNYTELKEEHENIDKIIYLTKRITNELSRNTYDENEIEDMIYLLIDLANKLKKNNINIKKRDTKKEKKIIKSDRLVE